MQLPFAANLSLDSLSERDRRTLKIGGIVAALLLLYVIIQLDSSVSSAHKRILKKQADLTWMRANGPELAQTVGSLARAGYVVALDEFQYFNRERLREFCSHLQTIVDALSAVAARHEATVPQMLEVGGTATLVAVLGVIAPFGLGWLVSWWLLLADPLPSIYGSRWSHGQFGLTAITFGGWMLLSFAVGVFAGTVPETAVGSPIAPVERYRMRPGITTD